MAKKEKKGPVSAADRLRGYTDGERVMRVKVMGMEQGFRLYENISVVYLKSREYQLMIMADYVPTFGRIEGEVILVSKDREIRIRNANGFFMMRKNVFELLMKEERYVVE